MAACGLVPLVDVHIRGKDNEPYPQSCATSGSVELMTGADAGPATSYTAGGATGTCTVETGPSVASSSALVSLTATVVTDDAGATHVLSVMPASQAPVASPPSALTIDNVVCTTRAPVFEPPTATDTRWLLSVGGTCGQFRTSGLWVSSRAEIPYPQPCGPSSQVMLEVNFNQPCHKLLPEMYSCTITEGPSLATGGQLVPVKVSVVDTSGRVYNAGFMPP